MMDVALAIVSCTQRAEDDITLFLHLFIVKVLWNRSYWVQGSTAPTTHWELAIVTLKVCRFFFSRMPLWFVFFANLSLTIVQLLGRDSHVEFCIE